MPDQVFRVGSVCSGVGGFELGLHRADDRFETVWACEWVPRRREILRRHFPGLPVHDDIQELNPDDLEPIDLLVGGTPCQDLSVAGKRGGLDAERSGLFHHFIRLRHELRPEWTLWENVPGAFSSNNGMDFASVLEAFVGARVHVPTGGWSRSGVAAGPRGGAVWRTLNSQHFGVPQRRHRVFVVGRLGGPVPPEVLLDPHRSEGHPPAGDEAGPGAAEGAGEEPRGAGIAGSLGASPNGYRSDLDGHGAYIPERSADDAPVAPETAATLSSAGNHKTTPNRRQEDDVNLVAEQGQVSSLTSRFGTAAGPDATDAQAGHLVPVAPPLEDERDLEGELEEDVSAPVIGRDAKGPPSDATGIVSFPANAGNRGPDEVHDDTATTVKGGDKSGGPAVAFVQNQREEVREVDQAMALSKEPGTHQETRVAFPEEPAGSGLVRRLTPTECERLQGFPDGWTILTGPPLRDALSHYQLEHLPRWEIEALTFDWQAGGHGDESWRGKSCG